MLFCMSFVIEFNSRFKKASTTAPYNTAPLSRDIISLDNEWLIRELISPLKPVGTESHKQ